MIVVTTDEIEGERIDRVLGLVRGNTVRARHMGRDIMAGLRGVVGGEIEEYTRLLSESRPGGGESHVPAGGGDGRQCHSGGALHDLGHHGRRVRDTGLRHSCRPGGAPCESRWDASELTWPNAIALEP